MRPSQAIKGKLPAIKMLVLKNGFKNPIIFGSVSRGADTEKSDLDIVVEKMNKDCTLLDLGTLSYELCELLGVEVDVKTVEMIPKSSRKEMLENGIPIP